MSNLVSLLVPTGSTATVRANGRSYNPVGGVINVLYDDLAFLTGLGYTFQDPLTQFLWDNLPSSSLAQKGFSREGGIRTVIAGDSRTFLSGLVDTTGGTTFAYRGQTSYYLPGAGAFASTADYGYFTWLDALMGAPHYLMKNAGVGGDLSGSLLTRYQADVINLNPELVYLWIGYNDFNSGLLFETVRDNVLAMLAMNDSINAFTCLLDCPYTANVASNATRRAEAAKFNSWLRELVRTRRNCVMVSASAAMADPDVSVIGSKATYVLTDAVHNNNLGALRVAEAAARVMTPLLRKWENYPVSPFEGFDADANAEIRNSNPLMAGTAGSIGTGITGSTATGYAAFRAAGSPTAVASKVAERENIGDAQRLAITFAAADDGVSFGVAPNPGPLNGNANARFLSGRYLEGQCDVVFDAASAAIINRMELYVGGTFNGIAFNTTAMRRVTSSSDQGLANNIQPLALAGRVLRLRTPRILITGTCSLLQYFVRFYASGAGAVTVDISRFRVRQSLAA